MLELSQLLCDMPLTELSSAVSSAGQVLVLHAKTWDFVDHSGKTMSTDISFYPSVY